VHELIALHVDVLVVSPKAVHAAREATKEIPIVCPTMSDAVKEGFVTSMAHPGGNVTGVSLLGLETDLKRLELVMEVIPNLKKLALLLDGTDPALMSELETLLATARRVGVNVRVLAARNPEQLSSMLKTLKRERPQALMVIDSAFTEQHSSAILASAANRLPVVSEGKDWADRGALLTYAASYTGMWRRSATYVDKILKGAKPSELPIEQPIKFELVVNLKTAKALGITVPESVLLRSDEVIQ